VTDEELLMIFDSFDKNFTGKLTYQEFRSGFKDLEGKAEYFKSFYYIYPLFEEISKLLK